MLATSRIRIRTLGSPGDLGWVIMAHGELYAAEFGWDTSFETLVAKIVADYATRHDPEREHAWIAELDGRRVGCVFCVAADETTAQLRILLVGVAVQVFGDDTDQIIAAGRGRLLDGKGFISKG